MADNSDMRIKVDQLRPGTSGLNLVVKVVDSKSIVPRGRFDGMQGRSMRMAECLVGDETAMIVFTAKNDQVEMMKPGATVALTNAKIDIFKSSMRLAVDKRGHIEVVTDQADLKVNQDNNLSLIEFEAICVYDP